MSNPTQDDANATFIKDTQVTQSIQQNCAISQRLALTAVSGSMNHASQQTLSILKRLTKKSKEVKFAQQVFKENYENAVKDNPITNIIDGETIAIKPENISIDGQCDFEDDTFDEKMKYVTKTLYQYQRKAILKIREIEEKGYVICPATGEKIVTNACILSLPIGAGKSLCYEILAMFYRKVTSHPIILSTDMKSIPIHEALQFKFYPFFCEKPCYVESVDEAQISIPSSNVKLSPTSNAVQTLDNYTQRPITLILTHDHLLLQMMRYFETDFKKKILQSTHIQYARSYHDVNFNKAGIIVIAATPENVNYISELSYQQPFMRVIADDMTDFSLDTMRQILASFTLFVSGSGFQRKPEEIPESYYSLKTISYPKISVVGNPEETYEGVMRNNICMVKLLGTNNPFSQYAFVSETEDAVKQLYHCECEKCYPILKSEPLIEHYINLMFILKNMDTMKIAISRIEQDLESQALPTSKVEYYLKWREFLGYTEKVREQLASKTISKQQEESQRRLRQLGRSAGRLQQQQMAMMQLPPSSSSKSSINPLLEDLYESSFRGSASAVPIVNTECICCGKLARDNLGYGALSGCCGAFYCHQCLKSMVTNKIIINNTTITDTNNYYCCCCRKKNCKFYLNTTKMKDKNIYAFSLVDDFFQEADFLESHFKVDYYFYMFMNGLTPKYREGKPLRVTENDSCYTEYSSKSSSELSTLSSTPDLIPSLECLYPADQLAIRSLYTINEILGRLQICPQKNTFILFFATPEYMISRVKYVKDDIVSKGSKETLVEYTAGSKTKLIQPIENLELIFRDNVSSLIGLHQNILAIIVWNKRHVIGEEENQMLGRIYRLNTFENPLYFYVENSIIEYA